MKSSTLPIYKTFLATATPEQIEFVDSVFALCEKNYSAGGDTVAECFTPTEVLEQFKTLADVRDYCGLRVEQEANARWGEDTDPELERLKAFAKWQESESTKPIELVAIPFIPIESITPASDAALLAKLVAALQEIRDTDHASDNATFAGRIDDFLWQQCCRKVEGN
jgi:hypothetical protein